MLGADEQGAWPLPWLAGPMAQAQALERAHALLLVGPAGVGQLEFAGLLAQAHLCEDPRPRGPSGSPGPSGPCGRCAACHLVRRRAHPDLLAVVPEAWRVRLGWLGDDEAGSKSDAKPSKDIRIEQVRQAIDWTHQTSGRGRGKLLLLHPADALNGPSANALLKTLEEPAAGLRILLTSTDPERLLPTIRSRCQRVRLSAPPADEAARWLAAQGIDDPQTLLALAGGTPLEALDLGAEGFDAGLLSGLPLRVAAGDVSPLAGRPLPRVIELLLKLAHDLQARAAGGAPRFFVDSQWPAAPSMAALVAWQKALLQAARHDEHPWNAALLVESLVTQAAALWPAAGTTRALNSAR
ncbi:DNA polymerase III subunit delta' [Aquincola sp. S2]|uniref:DNA polymerase III subunit delta n=2 Tax=Pseudaquabacterium terrae TaxID=2732868 RepID=A0ABX2EMB4_9BURK|nr:DNA polymerase III subunit delta' [Aquabacterium terrae]NRF69792.1 DNA polymerase III subunit delta' [Aquabacterium terrae]